ncbi:ABC-type glycerol-3-phosphate transport system, substrate-binding protein [Globicatella sulfidifaciens DSM 15739]|uniref:ABC-type glycerol-3-phosphate transport system, substrate-binding protein n=2 Tax=Globicatella sulfidifaciens TaxID=136093 RepID=A0A1T4MVK9_9LACT|nr:ABC-type glycerol-3-phosphate transport system, substrate-binding protein [Globicatella sulfidifaciens DSM 15739]
MKKTLLKFVSLLSVGAMAMPLHVMPIAHAEDQVEITFINHKTDWAGDGTWDRYLEEFNAVHPNIKVNIETITDYAGQVKTRMNSDQYGDVLMIPGDISPVDYATFFEPLGDKEELSKKYIGLNDRSFEGVQYGLPSQMNATGMVVNMQVFRDAGIETFPTTPEDFIAALKTIKEKNPEVSPLYTNYAAGWTLSNWDFVRAGASGNYDFTNEMTTDKEPFADGKTMNKIYKLLYDVAKEGLIEADPTTTDWEQSKVDLANGKIGVMVLGSWAIPQMQAANPDNAENIEFHPFPMVAEDGKQYLPVGGDYNYGISVHSEHKEEARIFIDWMVNESPYAEDNGGLPALIDGEYPAALKSIQEAGITLLEENPAPEGKESLFSDINNESELGIGSTDIEKQRIIDAAVGNTSETFEDMMAEFNQRWADAIEVVSGN